MQCDLWEPSERVVVGHGQRRRGWVVTSEACWSRAIAGTLIFSKEAPDILFGLARNLTRLGALPEKLVWDRAATRGTAQPFVRVDRNDYSIDPVFAGRRVELRVSQTEVTAVVLDTGEQAARHRRVFARLKLPSFQSA